MFVLKKKYDNVVWKLIATQRELEQLKEHLAKTTPVLTKKPTRKPKVVKKDK